MIKKENYEWKGFTFTAYAKVTSYTVGDKVTALVNKYTNEDCSIDIEQTSHTLEVEEISIDNIENKLLEVDFEGWVKV